MTCALPILLRHFENRFSELAAALMMFGISIMVYVRPDSVDSHAFDLIGVAIVDEFLGLTFFIVGSVRIVALVANGAWPIYGPWMRAMGALAGALIWSQMSLSLIIAGQPVPAIPIYVVLTAAELVSIYRALAGYYGQHHR